MSNNAQIMNEIIAGMDVQEVAKRHNIRAENRGPFNGVSQVHLIDNNGELIAVVTEPVKC